MNIEKQNYKILVSTQQEAEEIQKIFFVFGYKWAWQRYAEQRDVRLGFFIESFCNDHSLIETTDSDKKEITLPELREVFQKSPWGQIESLKAQLAQYQSDDCVVVSKAKINVAWQDTSEPENMVFKFSDLNMLGDCYEVGDLVEIEYYKSAYFNHQTVYGTWNKDKTHFFVGSKEECNAMIETAEKRGLTL